MMPRPRPETNENKKPQITQITQIFIFFLFVFSQLLIFPAYQLPAFRVSSCNFVAIFLVIFIAAAKISKITLPDQRLDQFHIICTG
jgi:hypothetical protein